MYMYICIHIYMCICVYMYIHRGSLDLQRTPPNLDESETKTGKEQELIRPLKCISFPNNKIIATMKF